MAAEAEAGKEKAAFDPGEKLVIDREPKEKKRELEPLPVAPEDWPNPSGQEVPAVDAPRYYPPQRDSTMTLTVEGI